MVFSCLNDVSSDRKIRITRLVSSFDPRPEARALRRWYQRAQLFIVLLLMGASWLPFEILAEEKTFPHVADTYGFKQLITVETKPGLDVYNILSPSALGFHSGSRSLPERRTASRQSSSVALVSNLGQTVTVNVLIGSKYLAQPFKTGGNSEGYALESVSTRLSDFQSDKVHAELWSSDPDEWPSTIFSSLTGTSATASGIVTFNAPPNTTLDPNTMYFFMIHADIDFEVRVAATVSNAEDSGAALDWFIYNQGFAASDLSLFGTHDYVYLIRVDGSEVGGSDQDDIPDDGVSPGDENADEDSPGDDDSSDDDEMPDEGDSSGGTDVRTDGAPSNQAPTVREMISALTLEPCETQVLDLSSKFKDPEGDALDFVAESSDETLVAVRVVENSLNMVGVARGVASITVNATNSDAESVSQTFDVTVSRPEVIWYIPPAAHAAGEGFVRVLNHSDHGGEVTMTAHDDTGRRYDPLMLNIGPRGVAQFRARDWELDHVTPGLTGATGMGEGGWRLQFDSDTLDVEALGYIRASDGFVTGVNATVPREADGTLQIATFKPASDVEHASLLRLVNPGTEEAMATVSGVDDAGRSAEHPVHLTLAAGSACTVNATQLESGSGLVCGLPQEGLGDGEGKWRLTVTSDQPLVAMNLLSSSAGFLANLARKAVPDSDRSWHVDLFPAASDPWRQGFMRVINRSTVRGSVSISVGDDSDTAYETLKLVLEAGEAVHLNSDDLELGNKAKGLRGSTGSGTGTWRLRLRSDLDIAVHAYVQTADGFLTSMQAHVPVSGSRHRVPFMNTAADHGQVGTLRMINRANRDVTVTVAGTDDRGLRPGTTVHVVVPATDAVELTAEELEAGMADAIASGALGQGTGSWRLRIEGPVAVMSLQSSSHGTLTNLSEADCSRGLGPLPAALLLPPSAVTLESPGRKQLRGRWSKVAGATYDVDRLRSGEREANHSLTRTSSTSMRWWSARSNETYTIRVRSVNSDGLRSAWRESNTVKTD